MTTEHDERERATEPAIVATVTRYEREERSNRYGAGMEVVVDLQPWENIEALPDGTELITADQYKQAIRTIALMVDALRSGVREMNHRGAAIECVPLHRAINEGKKFL